MLGSGNGHHAGQKDEGDGSDPDTHGAGLQQTLGSHGTDHTETPLAGNHYAQEHADPSESCQTYNTQKQSSFDGHHRPK